VGFLHDLRSGRPSLGLDLVEEFRAPIADRLALNLINRRQLNPDDFENQSDGAVLLNRSGRHTVLTEFRRKMLETTPHPLREAPVPVGLLPHIQAKLLARRIRGEDPAYKPYVPR
jgi:CRISPR-associated protein Cas1